MSNVLWYLGVYLIIGAGVIVLLNALTKGRIFKNFDDTVYDGQDVLFAHGFPVRTELMKYVMIAIVWLFWPALTFGVIEKNLKKSKEKDI